MMEKLPGKEVTVVEVTTSFLPLERGVGQRAQHGPEFGSRNRPAIFIIGRCDQSEMQ